MRDRSFNRIPENGEVANIVAPDQPMHPEGDMPHKQTDAFALYFRPSTELIWRHSLA
jgi:hypothetical protein